MPKNAASPLKSGAALAPLVAWTVMLVVGLLAYSNSLRVPFVLDDLTNIQDNPYMQVEQLDVRSLCDATFKGPSSRRPVPKFTLALNYYVGGGRVWGYHAVNLAIHLACGALVYLLGWEILQRAPLPPSAVRWAALTAALAFLSHPIQIQAVTYVIQRMASMAAMFYLAALLFYAYGRTAGTRRSRWSWWGAALVSWLLSLGCKENAITFPVAVLLYEFYFLQHLSGDWLTRTLKFVLPALALLALLIAVSPGIRAEALAGYEARDFTMGERVLTQFRVVVFYLSLVVWPLPSRFCLTHSLTISHGWFDPATTFLSFLVLLGLFAFAVVGGRRWPVVSLGIMWMFLNLALESSILPLELAYEHRMYLPMAGIAWAAAWVLFATVRDVRYAACVAAGVVVLLASATYSRNEVWRSTESLWRDVLVKYPQDARAHNNIGYGLVLRGNIEEGLRYYRLAIERNPRYADPYYNLGTILDAQGQTEEATKHYRRAVELNPRLFQAHNNLGNKLAQQGKVDEAIEHFRLALELSHRFALGHNNLGNALGLKEMYDEAIAEYRQALDIDPEYAQARFSLANLLAAQGERAEALEHYRRALELATAQGNRPLAGAIRAQLQAYQ